MRKTIYLPVLGLVLLTSFNAFSQKRSPFVATLTYLQYENLKGVVKTINAKKYAIEGREGTNFIATLKSHIITTFDRKGNRVGEERFLGDSSKSGSATKVYNYNDQGFAVGTSFYIKGKQDGKSVLELDKKGNLKESKLLDSDGKSIRRVLYQLDANGRNKEQWEYFGNDSLPRKTLFYYYKEDNKSVEKYYSRDGAFSSWNEYTFNDKGLIIQEMKYEKGGGPIGRILFTYDARGNLLERLESVRNANNTTRYIYTYDENDNITSLKKYDKDEKLIETKTYAYLYDAKGNWLEKLEYIDGIEKNVDKRTVAYY